MLMKTIWYATLLFAISPVLAQNDTDSSFTAKAVQDVLNCNAESSKIAFWIAENFVGFYGKDEFAGEKVGRFVNQIDNMTYRYRLPFKVRLTNPLDGKEVEGRYVAIRSNAIYLEIDWSKYAELHSLYRQKYQGDLQDLILKFEGKNVPRENLHAFGYDIAAEEESIIEPNKKVKVWKYFGFATVFKADVVTGDSDKGYIGCRY